MSSNLEKAFAKIGARVNIVYASGGRRARDLDDKEVAARLNIITKGKQEEFEIAISNNLRDKVDLSVLEVRPQDRHLVLLARRVEDSGQAAVKNHFLCGHDERHLFVASVEAVSTIAAAMGSLKPNEILGREVGLNSKKRNRRKTKQFKRQGEWFFLPAEINPNPLLVLKNEPLVRGTGSKPHIAQFAFRTGGQTVKVCRQYPNGITYAEYERLIASDPSARQHTWRDMRRNAIVYVMGKVRHPDHATVVLDSWHRVLMNTERRTKAVAFLD